MALVVQQSLLEAGGGAPMVESARWIESVMLGEIALGVCIIAVAFIGALMLTGRLPLREGAQIVVGCFVLLGAPVIAAGMLEFAISPFNAQLTVLHPNVRSTLRQELPEASYNPYAQASVRDDW
ncbi:TrbC/VirB2 family protein [Porphyrobacter sp. YT40]|uniref:TrbC/VirB2 family protein n=1 Tax=Porphyrobacter sp. YT40 TaxID=2547601 RepID=UPI001144BD0E|nr:TrbC/VirB2 family protein [Porphyrobacter sp. YT40]QDH34043.1 TrbC/VirB2 family protein [Porphyrobacter sp. YT40]